MITSLITHPTTMYLPAHFEQPDRAAVEQLIRESPVATLVTMTCGAIEANHVPMMLALRGDTTILSCHVARANPVWRETDSGSEVLAIFHGPDTYISPSWYATKAEHGKVVPTWNYAVVHAYGRLTAFEDKAWLREFLPALTARHEARFDAPWQVGDAPPDFVDRMMGAVVGIEIEVTRIRAKWKVSQNQPEANKTTLAVGLAASDQRGAKEMAGLLAEQMAGGKAVQAPGGRPVEPAGGKPERPASGNEVAGR